MLEILYRRKEKYPSLKRARKKDSLNDVLALTGKPTSKKQRRVRELFLIQSSKIILREGQSEGGHSEGGLDPVKSFLRVRGFAFSPLCVFKCEGLGSPKSLYQVDFDLHLITLNQLIKWL